MNPPEWPGQNPPPGQPGYPPPPPGQPGYSPQGPYGQPYGGPPPPGFPPPGPPRPPSGSGPLIPLMIIGGVILVVIVAVGAFFVLRDDGKKDNPPVVLPSTSGGYPSPTESPSSSTSQSATTSDMSTILKPTVSTAAGTTYTRAGIIRTGSCASRAGSDLAKALVGHSCVQDMQSALYSNPDRSVVTVVSILKFADATNAQAVNDKTSDGADPTLLLPPSGSGLPALSRNPSSWTRSWTKGSYVIYSQGYYASGKDAGERNGTVYTTSGELGIEIANVIMWAN
ncbi:hypothetical protein J4573_45100 [Actinomadura barringtoniae]|uniref:Uncharacterized protein n=1 Tax=Actinomadura barringtoniae TaxID=1427535 RepID=A0A939PKA5_9ACTN|nr:hypothetical protein [Actinomadura barringtoniae]MBO2454331.1 hypothetical protein [Actinomadura barringtoniae]